MVSHTVYFKGMMVFTLTSQMYHRISVLVPVLVRVLVHEYKYEYYDFGTHEYEYKKFSTTSTEYKYPSPDNQELASFFLVHSVIQSNYVSPLHRRCTIEYQYSCQYSYEYLSTCPRVQVRVLWLWNSRVRVQEIQYYEYWVRVPQPW